MDEQRRPGQARGRHSKAGHPVREAVSGFLAGSAGPTVSAVVAVAVIAAALGLATLAARWTPAEDRALAAGTPAERLPLPTFVPRGDLSVTRVPVPTPVFATYRTLKLHLPVRPSTVTLIAFHQAGSARPTFHMRSLQTPISPTKLATASAIATRSKEPTAPDETAEIAAAESSPAPASFAGKVTRLYRTGRAGIADTAVDVGTKPGNQVYSPVDGTVVAVKRYLLYGLYTDYEVHIIPTGFPLVDVTMLHVMDPSVREGQAVVAGITPVAKVRWLSKLFEPQLDEYTHDGGNHVHVQLDVAPAPGVVRLLGSQRTESLSQLGLTPKASRPATSE